MNTNTRSEYDANVALTKSFPDQCTLARFPAPVYTVREATEEAIARAISIERRRFAFA
jgi:hypothetical protein